MEEYQYRATLLREKPSDRPLCSRQETKTVNAVREKNEIFEASLLEKALAGIILPLKYILLAFFKARKFDLL